MEISYKSKKLEKQLTKPKEIAKSFGTKAKKINQRIKDLSGVETLADMRQLPAAGCHELTGDRKGKLAVKVSGNYRLIFEPNHNPLPQKDDGGLDWSQVTKIRVLDVEDYH